MTGLALALIVPQLLLHAPAPETPPFAPGERLHYKGYLFGWLPVGDAWFDIASDTRDGRPAYRFDARALGRYLVYTLDIRLTSFVDRETLRSMEFRRREVGTERRDYCVIFDRTSMRGTYRRKAGRFTTIGEMDAAPWQDRSRFSITADVNDILYTLYFARGIGDTVGTSRLYRFVEKDYIWNTAVTILGEEKLDLRGVGSFDALKVSITPDYSDQPVLGRQFAGLFGISGSLDVWVERGTRIPLIVRGQVPFTRFFSPAVTVVLRDRALPSAGSFK
ncbi:MAG: DUF3108 domain-containing protein [Candidatus Aureabacteria bacterium]|nr:DUF3108 domain-containing protein [Candidatus Auribacterota bacterium]